MTVEHDWTDNIDWDNLADPNGTGNPPKWAGHLHDRADDSPMDEMHGVIDFLSGEGPDTDGNYINEPFSVFCATRSHNESYWPWTDPPNGEARDPEELGVVAVPGYEMHFGTHSYAFFSTASEDDVLSRFDDYDPDDGRGGFHAGLPEKLQSPIDGDNDAEHKPEALVGFAHPLRYIDDDDDITDREYERFRFNVERLANQDVASVLGSASRRQPSPRSQALELWDRLLTDFAPNYLPHLTAHQDAYAGGFVVGSHLDRRFASLLLDEDEFDPSDQEESRQAARDAWADGRALAHIRDGWDAESESPPDTPMVDEAGVEDGTIYVESDASTTEWVSAGGEIVETGESVNINDCEKYVRCQIFNADESAGTLTQPWAISHS